MKRHFLALFVSMVLMFAYGSDSIGQQAGAPSGPNYVTPHHHSGSLDGGIIHLPSFLAYRQAGFSLTSGTPTQIVFDTVTKNDNSWYSNSTGNFQPNVAGYYLVSVNLGVTCATTITQAQANIVNGNTTVVYASPFINASLTGGANQNLSASTIMFLNGSTDYVKATAYVVGTGACSLNTGTFINFSAMFLSY